MKTFKNLLSLTFITLLAYSCEPEELPNNTSLQQDIITADTGDQDDEVEERNGEKPE
ncbi:hypothetical protein INR75_19780 [Zunongwangia sp. SCSIO 43204]|uniref:hypothetical protein n=1 Tax=unclassified Zunongwangia TaxID=2632541 RepID=UPI001CA806F1|nr:hypothetical protein [Zunongwangia sp. SCSIO 43204]UAB84365.1 hypothetical protein INR75_19780 [Zunongwangia sp. SCSIO 43204]|tara:strand:- start:319 stop:489 length:171 start_codon:yes stop_codon:yes gene_type:complete